MQTVEAPALKASKQARKHAIGMAGEFLVAGELLRRGVTAAVTYGNAKKADVLVVNDSRAISLEVKTTSETKWILGNTVPDESGKLWVLVYLPPELTSPPEYFVLAASELRAILWPQHEAYLERYRAKNDREFEGKGVVSIRREQLGPAGQWSKILRAVGVD